MEELRLSNLAILSIKQEMTEEIYFEGTISDFAQMKAKTAMLQ